MTVSRKYLIPAAWLTVSAGAFWSGRILRPDGADDASSSLGTSAGTGAITSAEHASPSRERDRGSPASSKAGAPHDPHRSGLLSAGGSKLGSLSAADIAALAETYRTATDPLNRREAFLALLSGLTKDNAALIRKELGNLNPGDPDFRDFFFAYGKAAGLEAVMSGVTTDAPDMGPTLAGWAAADPAAAAAWFRNLNLNDPAYAPLIKDRGIPPEQLRSYLARDLVASLANSDPAGALAIATMRGADGRTIPGLMDTIASQVLQRDGLEGAIKWAQNIPSDAGFVSYRRPDGQYEMENVRGEAMRTVAQTYAKTDPRGAAEWALANTNPGDNPWIMRDVSIEWAKKFPVDAVDWLESQNGSRGQQESISAAFAQWAGKDPHSSSQHLADMAPSTTRDYAINGFTSSLASEDPASAVAWAAQIGNAGLREAATVRAGEKYFAQNPAAAAAWLPTSGLSPQAQAGLLAGKH